jgi:hypothetical protein
VKSSPNPDSSKNNAEELAQIVAEEERSLARVLSYVEEHKGEQPRVHSVPLRHREQLHEPADPNL